MKDLKSNRLKDLKHEYDNIEIPDRLDDVIMDAFNMNNKKDSKKTSFRFNIYFLFCFFSVIRRVKKQ